MSSLVRGVVLVLFLFSAVFWARPVEASWSGIGRRPTGGSRP